jgi:hypothetical protein
MLLTVSLGYTPSYKYLNRRLAQGRKNGFHHAFFAGLHRKHDGDGVVFLSDRAGPLKDVCRLASISDTNVTEI